MKPTSHQATQRTESSSILRIYNRSSSQEIPPYYGNGNLISMFTKSQNWSPTKARLFQSKDKKFR
jgi:hypothetical protein